MSQYIPLPVKLAMWLVDLIGRRLRKFLASFSPFWKQGTEISEPRKILILHNLHLGDTIVTTPALRALRLRFPNSFVVFLAQSSGAQVLKGNPDVNEVRVFHAPWLERSLPHYDVGVRKLVRLILYYFQCVKRIWQEGKNLKAEGFDLAIDLVGTFHHYLLMVLACIPLRVGPVGVGDWLLTHPVPLPDPRKINEIDRCLQIVQAIGANSNDRKPSVYCAPEAEISLSAKLKSLGILSGDLLVVIHPGCASAPASRWQSEKWAKVADWLIQEYGAKVVLNGVNSERREIEAIKARMKGKAFDLCGQLTIPELIALIKRCNLLLTVNSGPMHIASALGTPMVVVQGAWNLTRWRPFGDNHILVVKKVPCTDCGYQICPKPVSCMDMVEPEEVIEAVKEKLQQIDFRKFEQ